MWKRLAVHTSKDKTYYEMAERHSKYKLSIFSPEKVFYLRVKTNPNDTWIVSPHICMNNTQQEITKRKVIQWACSSDASLLDGDAYLENALSGRRRHWHQASYILIHIVRRLGKSSTKEKSKNSTMVSQIWAPVVTQRRQWTSNLWCRLKWYCNIPIRLEELVSSWKRRKM